MFDFLIALWIGFVGACIGSFLNVVAYRLPRGMSIIWKPSHCPKCKHLIRARDNVPVLGWLLLQGRCRDCGAAISPRYAIVEGVLGLVFFVLAYVELVYDGANLPGGPLVEETGAVAVVLNPQWNMIALYAYHAALMSLLTAIVLIAWDRQRIPPAIFALTILGLVPPALGLLPMTEEDPARFWTAQFLWMISLVILGLAWSRLFPLRGGNAKTMQQRAGALDEFTSALLAATVFLPTAIKFRLLFLSITIVLAIVATLVNRSRAAAVWAATLLTLLGCQSIWRWFE